VDILSDILLFLHFLGLASLFGGLFVQVRSAARVVNNAVFHGVLTQLVTGLLMVGLAEAGTDPVDHVKIGVKLVVALVVGGLVLANRRRDVLAGGVYGALLGLTVLNVAVAVFWP
jgi:hypothetical protein